MDNTVYWIWLQQALPSAWPYTARLLRDLGNARTVYEQEENAYRAVGISGSVLSRLKNKSLAKAEKIRKQAEDKGYTLLTPDHPHYPDGWAALPDLPLVLYVNGIFPEDFDRRLSLTVVATRHITQEGMALTGKLAAGLSVGGAILVGDTIAGGDCAAMTAVSSVGGLSVIVQPCGIDVSYPKQSEDLRRFLVESGGVVLSEFPMGTPVRRENFALRNRLLATLSQAVVVTEAGETSGTLRVAGLAVTAGHEVFAVPGDRIRHAGCHRLIRDGAVLVQSAADILQEFESRYPYLRVDRAKEAQRQYRVREIPSSKRGKAENAKPSSKRTPRAAKQSPVIPFSVVEQSPPREEAVFSPLPSDLSDEAVKLASLLTAQPQGADALAEALDKHAYEIISLLTELELSGVAVSHPGGRYSRR